MTPADRLHDELLDLAVKLAATAGELLVSGRPADLRVADTKSSATDVVTEMDRASERLIVDSILAARPGDGVLGEEGSDRAGTSGVRWVIDPIDGTVNYLYGIPLWSVSIGVEVDGVMEVGVVEMAALQQTFTAVRGRGATMHRAGVTRGLRVNDPVSLDRALVGTGFGYTVERRTTQAAVVAELLPRVRDIRRGGACSVDLCWVASGLQDAYYESGAQPWDLAAGGLIAAEAGALVTGLAGAQAGEAMALAAGPALHRELDRTLQQLTSR